MRGELLKKIAVAVGVGILQFLVLRALGPFTDQPWVVAACLVVLAATVAVLGRPLYRDKRLALGGGFLGFLVAYCAFFSIAAGSDLLSGRRTPLQGYDESLPRNWLGLNVLGDWHYKLLPPSPPMRDSVIVMIPTTGGKSRAEMRWSFAFLIQQAIKAGAKGVAFDYYLEGETPVDRVLCANIQAAAKVVPPMTVLFGYQHELQSGLVTPAPLPPSLGECPTRLRVASLAGYREADSKVRMVPLYLEHRKEWEALSLQVARTFATPLSLPSDDLVRFSAPRDPPVIIDGWPTDEDARLFRDRFVFVGSRDDVHETPFGALPGVQIHAYAAHSLLTGSYISRLPPIWSFPMLFGICYGLALVQERGGDRRGLVLAAAALSAAIVAGAVLAIHFGRLWIDISYPLIGGWLFAGLLSGGAAVHARRLRIRGPVPSQVVEARVPAPDPEPALSPATARGTGVAPAPQLEVFDVFLSHNSDDKPMVRQIARALEARQVHVWLDEDHLPPGQPWVKGLEAIIETVRSAAVIIGPSGIGPWEEPEMSACLSEEVDRHMPVIPVLLPGLTSDPKLPLFLRANTWVDFRGGISKEQLDRLVWGITGYKPKS